MRLVMWLCIPVAIFSAALLYTIMMNWVYGVPFCETWVRGALPLCH